MPDWRLTTRLVPQSLSSEAFPLAALEQYFLKRDRLETRDIRGHQSSLFPPDLTAPPISRCAQNGPAVDDPKAGFLIVGNQDPMA